MDSIIARQAGEDYQANFFWCQAAKLYRPGTNVKEVEWESKTSATGFDDVVVKYDPGTRAGASLIRTDAYQVKFHVDHKRQFTWEAFTDPSFIGTKEATILKRLYQAYLNDNDVAEHTRFHLINSWGLDAANDLGTFLDNNDGGFRLHVLFDGKGDNTKYGRIRKAWRDHLGIDSDDVLRQILKPLRIRYSFPPASDLYETLNLSLQHAQLKTLEADKHVNAYADLIKRLHASGQTTFTRDSLMAICKAENLHQPATTSQKDNAHKIGIRSFQPGAEKLHLEVDETLCLLGHFSGRFLSKEGTWSEIAQLLVPLFQQAIALNKPLELYLDTHLTVAFAAGHYMGPKTGLPVTVVQKIPAGKIKWTPDPTPPASGVPQLSWESEVLNTEGTELVLALSITHDNKNDTTQFAQTNLPAAHTILSGTILPTPSNTSIRDANHILATVFETVTKVREQLSHHPATTRVHIFLTAPNGFAFFLGQYAAPFGPITLYEYDFARQRGGGYQEAISLPL